MAAQLRNNDPNMQQVIVNALADYGIPVARALQMARAYATSTDYLQDVKAFVDNYKRFQELQTAAQSLDIKLVENLAGDKLQELAKKLNDSEKWNYLSGVLPEAAADQSPTDENLAQKQHLEQQMEELQKFQNKWNKVFNSEEAMQQKANELLQRNFWLKVIELGLVFKDVCLGINKVIQTNKKLQSFREELLRIHNDYVEPTIEQFRKNGTINEGTVQTALMQLRYIRTQCQVEQKNTSQSIFGHLANAFSMGFHAYTSIKNGSALADIASKAVLNQTYIIGGLQGGLAVGSLILSGVEAYNWVQYNNIIDDVNAIVQRLEFYANQLAKSK